MRIQIDGITLDFENQTSPTHALAAEVAHHLFSWLRQTPNHDVIGKQEPKPNGPAVVPS